MSCAMALSSTRRARTQAYAESGVLMSSLPPTDASARRRSRPSAARVTMVSQSHLLNDDRTYDYDRDTLGSLAPRLANHRARNSENCRRAIRIFATRSLALHLDRGAFSLFSPQRSGRSDATLVEYALDQLGRRCFGGDRSWFGRLGAIPSR